MSKNNEGYNLWRIDWEEPSIEDETVFVKASAFAPSQVDIDVNSWGGVDGVRNVTARLATAEEEDAYQAGFEDGFDVATLQQRIQQMQDGVEEAVKIDRENTLSGLEPHEENCQCGGLCGCN